LTLSQYDASDGIATTFLCGMLRCVAVRMSMDDNALVPIDNNGK